MFSYSKNVLVTTSLLLCSVLCKGAPTKHWDPLPARVRSVVSSNHVGEGTLPGVFAEYHALLPNYRGDYGVKSELVNAASEVPIYKGAETILLPLYIPRGAVPLSVNERQVRSGKADDIANMRILRGPSPSLRDSSPASAINRPVRRVLPPARRSSSGLRVSPTPPAAYLRTWIKRRNASKPSEVEREDNVEGAKKSKYKILTQTAPFRKREELLTKDEDSSSTESTLESLSTAETTTDNGNTSIEKRNKESVRIKKIMKRIGSRPSTHLSDSSLQATAGLWTPMKNINQTFSKSNVRLPSKNVQNDAPDINQKSDETDSNTVSSSPPPPPATTTPTTTTTTPTTKNPITEAKTTPNVSLSTSESTPVKSSVLKIIRRRPVFMNKTHDDSARNRKRPVVPSRNAEDASSSDEDELGSNKFDVTEEATPQTSTSSTPRLIAPSLRLRNSSNVAKQNAKTSNWFHRRRESILRERDSNRQVSRSSEKKEDSESIIDRVLNSAANQNNNEKVSNRQLGEINSKALVTKSPTNSSSNISSVLSNINRRKAILNRYGNDTRVLNINKEIYKQFYPLPLGATETPRTTGFSLRQRIPLRLRRPIVSNPVKTTTPTTTITTTTPTETSRSTTSPTTTIKTTTSTETSRSTSKPSTTTISIVTDSSSSSTSSFEEPIFHNFPKRVDSLPFLRHFEEGGKPRNGFYRTNIITTSTPKSPYSSSTESYSKPKTYNTHVSSTKETSGVPVVSNTGSGSSRNRSSYALRFTPSTPLPRMKSPQDIVLEKLSNLMKNTTRGRKDNVEMIIQEIEKLNKELASMGIHIIDAEFDGHKIKLKDQEEINGSGINLSGATTIRYVIPNAKIRSRTKHIQPEIINHEDSNENSSDVDSSVTKDNYQIQSKRTKPSTERPYNRYRSSLGPNTKFFTLRRRNESSTNLALTSPVPPILATLEDLSSSQASNEESDGSNESLEQIAEQILSKPYSESDRNEISSEISIPTTHYSLDTTTVSSSAPSLTGDRTRNFEVESKVLKNLHNNGTNQNYKSLGTPPIEATTANPSAHLRPSVSKEFPEISDSEFSTSLTAITTGTSPITTFKESVVSAVDESEETTFKQLPSNEIWEDEVRPKVVGDLEHSFPFLVSEQENVLGSKLSEKSATEESSSYIYLIGILGIVPCLAALAILYRQRLKRQKKSLPEREERAEGLTPPTNHTRSGHNDTLDAFPGYIFDSAPQRDSPWELSRSKLRVTAVIGEGNFGMVWKAEARNLCEWDGDGAPTVLVAVKGVKEGAGIKEKNDLLRELSIMQHLGEHSNIVTLLGCCTTQEPYLLVMEYVMFGKLLTFLREQRSKNNCFNFSSDSDHLTSRDLTKFACQIATGCEYLQSRGVIHRDLAARNILVNHNKVCKIADFGLARSVKDMDNDIYEQKSKGPLPIRWMAPESLFMNIFTHKSDVWSFGILCWEIVTLGSTPYPGISAREVMRRVREGYRLERPEHCRPEFYKIVTKCWHQDLNKRASFTVVKEEILDLLENYSGWIDLENFQDSTYYSMHQNNEEKL